MSKNTDKKWKFLKLNGTINRKYKVSDQGDIVIAKGMVPLKQTNMAKKSPTNGTDYQAVCIPGMDNRARVHRVVCETFHGKAPTGKIYVAHADDRKNNNTAANLSWVTPSENVIAYNSTHKRPKYSEIKISQVKRLLNKGWSNDRVAQKVKMSDSNVSAIKLGYIHSDITPFTEDQISLGN